METSLVAPCGINCNQCIAYFGYTMSGKPRVHTCNGCRPKDKNCAFLKQDCDLLSERAIDFCFECDDYPCENLKKIDRNYQEKYKISLIENLEFIRDKGVDEFLENQKAKYACSECGSPLCIHDGRCYTCLTPNQLQ